MVKQIGGFETKLREASAAFQRHVGFPAPSHRYTPLSSPALSFRS
jgi:hypothetical protein